MGRVAELGSLARTTHMSDEMPFKVAAHKLKVEHADRYDAFTRLLFPLSFGGLMFLLAFEKDYAPAESSARWLVQAAWFLMLASSLTGVGLQAALVWSPIHRLEGARIVADPEHGMAIHISGEISMLERVWFWSHLTTFASAVVALGVYKGMNL